MTVGSTFLPQAEQGKNEHDDDHQADQINDTVHLKSPLILSGQHQMSVPRPNNVGAGVKFPVIRYARLPAGPGCDP